MTCPRASTASPTGGSMTMSTRIVCQRVEGRTMNPRRPSGLTTLRSVTGLLGLALLAVLGGGAGGGEDQAKTVLKTEHFDRDPDWEGFNNRIVLKRVPAGTQDLGYSPTNFGGKEKGEMGGRVQRSTTPAYYADKIAVKTLNDKLAASGTFALTSTAGNAGVFFGWFNAEQPGGSGRPVGSLGLDFDAEPTGGAAGGPAHHRHPTIARDPRDAR